MATTAVAQKADPNTLAEQRTNLALERTFMAADRTLMAWVRTSISMIGFGFTLYKFLEYLHQQNAGAVALNGPRNLGLAFIGLALFSLLVATLQYWQYMRRIGGSRPRRFNLGLVVAGFVALIGVLALTNLLLRIGPF